MHHISTYRVRAELSICAWTHSMIRAGLVASDQVIPQLRATCYAVSYTPAMSANLPGRQTLELRELA